jgi:hypothetical protein
MIMEKKTKTIQWKWHKKIRKEREKERKERKNGMLRSHLSSDVDTLNTIKKILTR